VAAGLPLIFYGGLHLIDPDGFLQLLHAAGEAFSNVTVVVVPLMEMVAGIVLLVGMWVRAGALLAVVAMIPALHTKLVLVSGQGAPDVDPSTIAQAPPLWVPVLVLACAIYVLVRGAGAFSGDFRATHPPFEEERG
jgi:uncharacterized membrane protein YphA (DoxX/SURF4 family)